MGLLDEYNRIEAGRLIKVYKEDVVRHIEQIRIRLQHIVNAKVTYPDVTEELDGYITQAKNALSNLINQF